MDLDPIREEIIKAFENNYLAENMVSGSDLVHHYAVPGFLETNRNSNFKSSFRPLTGEKVILRNIVLIKSVIRCRLWARDDVSIYSIVFLWN